MTFTQPNASTLGSFLTIAFFLDIRKTPRARVTVVTIGRPSGIAATARETSCRVNFLILLYSTTHTSDSEHLQPSPILYDPNQTDNTNHAERNKAELLRELVHGQL